MSEVTVAHLEGQLADQKTLVEMRDAVQRLVKNRDFKKVILDSFCLTEAARYVQESADPLLPAANRADALAMAQASGHLKRFLTVVIAMGNAAANQQSALEREIDEARAEEGDA